MFRNLELVWTYSGIFSSYWYWFKAELRALGYATCIKGKLSCKESAAAFSRIGVHFLEPFSCHGHCGDCRVPHHLQWDFLSITGSSKFVCNNKEEPKDLSLKVSTRSFQSLMYNHDSCLKCWHWFTTQICDANILTKATKFSVVAH